MAYYVLYRHTGIWLKHRILDAEYVVQEYSGGARRSYTMAHAVKVRVKSSRSRYVALDAGDKRKVLVEGKTLREVADRAGQLHQAYTILYVPEAGRTYVF